MKQAYFAVLMSLAVAGPAFAGMTCTDIAVQKKLYGAARTSFVGKCERDAKASCDTAAVEKKIYGAAKTSFTTKCVKDAIGE